MISPAEYGSVQMTRLPDGRVWVAHADDRIGVTHELVHMLVEEGSEHVRPDGTLVLDTDERYQYRPTGETDLYVAIYERI